MMRRAVPVAAATFMCLLALGTQVPAQQTPSTDASSAAMVPAPVSPTPQAGEASASTAAPASPATDAAAEGKPAEAGATSEPAQEAPAETAEAAANRAAAAGSVHLLKGRISYYGLAFKGRKTACGGHFNPKELTMAHKTLPCGSLVKVTDVRTGKWVLVHVTDHGPNVRGRVADLSTAAAVQLGLIHQGVTEGQLDVMKYGPPSRGRPGR